MKLRRSLITAVIIPTLLVQTGMSMGNAFIPLYARQVGASMAGAAFVSALLFLGQAMADLPGGWLVHRFGEKRIMTAGGLLLLAAMLLRVLSSGMPLLTVSVLVFGCGTSLLWISRMSWMKKEVSTEERGHAMSFVGGSLRMAALIGPIIGGPVAERFGYRILFITQGLLTLVSVLLVLLTIPATTAAGGTYRRSVTAAKQTWDSARFSILAAALGIGGLTILRASREILFPLWGSELGLGESLIGVVLFAGALVDTAFFWLSGLVMTRWGRKAAAITCTAGFAVAIGLLPLAHGIAGLTALAMLAGLGNSIGAGINLTVSGDLAPLESPAAFLSVWRFFMGFAGFGGPALAAWLIGGVGRAAAPPAVAAMGFAGALAMVVFMRETRRN